MAADLTSEKLRVYLADVPTIDVTLPVTSGVTIYAGSYCMISSGAVASLSGSGVFGGIALETVVNGSGATTIRMRIQGAFEAGIEDTITTATHWGVDANHIEATNTDTLRLETGTTITGTKIGEMMRVITAGASGTNKVVVAFKATALLP